MANAPHDRTNIGIRERPLSGDHNQQSSQESTTLRELCRMLLSPRGAVSQVTQASTMESASCLIGDGFRIEAPGGMFVEVAAGHGFFYDPADIASSIGSPDLEGVDDLSSFKPILLSAPAVFAVPAAPGPGQGRTDIIEIRADRRLENAVTRRQLDTGTVTFVDKIFSKTLAFALDGRVGTVAAGGGNSTAGISYKIGTAAAVTANGDRRDGNSVVTPPSVSPGYIKLGDIQVNNGTTAITQALLNDRRSIASIGGVVPFAATWRLQWGGGTPVVTLLALNAPPGIRAALLPSAGVRGAGTVAISGGEIASATCVVTGAFPGSDGTALYVTEGPTSGAPVAASGIQVTSFDSATPPLIIGGRSKAIVYPFASKAVINGGEVNNTSSVLENVFITACGTLRY